MHSFSRAAGAFVATAALCVVAAPANATTGSALTEAASIATSKSVVSDLPVQTEMNTRFKPWKCDERRYFRNHERKCVRFWVRESERDRRDGDGRGDRDGRRGDGDFQRGEGDRDGGRGDNVRDNDRQDNDRQDNDDNRRGGENDR